MIDWGVGGEERREGGSTLSVRVVWVVRSVASFWFWVEGRGIEGTTAWRRKLGTGVSTRPPIAWIVPGSG